MAGEKLGEISRRLKKRYEQAAERVRHYSLPDLIADKVERTVWGFLNEFGFDHPIDFDQPPPDVYVPSRQGTHCLEPKGSTDGASPPNATDQACITFKARSSGFLVIDYLDFIMEDPISEEWFTIAYRFDEQVNTANQQCRQAEKQIGHWKFSRMVLVDNECLTVCISNTNPYAGGCFSFESRSWAL